MCGGELLKLDPFSLCLLKRHLDDLFSMVDVREFRGKLLGRKSRKNVFGIFEMKYPKICVPNRNVTMFVFFFGANRCR
jgi:hypothetical protein